MRQTKNFNINVPELGDVPNITQVSDAISHLEDALAGTVEVLNASISGSALTLSSGARTTKRTRYYDGMTVKFVAPSTIQPNTLTTAKVDALSAQVLEIPFLVNAGDSVDIVYKNNKFVATIAAIQRSDSVSSNSSTTVGTSKAVKLAYEKAVTAQSTADGKVNKSGDTMTGALITPLVQAGLDVTAQGSIAANQNIIANANLQANGDLHVARIGNFGGVRISASAPIIELNETDTGKKTFIVTDGGGGRIQHDGTDGKNILSWDSGNTITMGEYGKGATLAPDGTLNVGGSVRVPYGHGIDFNNQNAGLGWKVLEEPASGELRFYTRQGAGADSQAMAISQGGNLLIDNTHTLYNYARAGGIYRVFHGESGWTQLESTTHSPLDSYLGGFRTEWYNSNGLCGFYRGGGTNVASWLVAFDGMSKMRLFNTGDLHLSGSLISQANVVAYSDIKLKKDLEVIPDALDKIGSVNGYTYTRKDTGERQAGVVAQEIQKILPEVINITKNEETGEETLGVAYGNIVGLLIEGIKELNEKVKTLEEKLGGA